MLNARTLGRASPFNPYMAIARADALAPAPNHASPFTTTPNPSDFTRPHKSIATPSHGSIAITYYVAHESPPPRILLRIFARNHSIPGLVLARSLRTEPPFFPCRHSMPGPGPLLPFSSCACASTRGTLNLMPLFSPQSHTHTTRVSRAAHNRLLCFLLAGFYFICFHSFFFLGLITMSFSSLWHAAYTRSTCIHVHVLHTPLVCAARLGSCPTPSLSVLPAPSTADRSMPGARVVPPLSRHPLARAPHLIYGRHTHHTPSDSFSFCISNWSSGTRVSTRSVSSMA